MKYCNFNVKVLSVVMILILLKIPTTFSEPTDDEVIDYEKYKTFLYSLLSASKQLQRRQDTSNEILKEQTLKESPYERVIRNLRTNWETPMNYLQERGYLKNSEPKMGSGSNPLSIDDLINGPLLNPSTLKNFNNVPRNQDSIVTSDRSDRNCNYPSMYNDLSCFDQYFGNSMAKSIKDKWDSWFHKNQSTTTTTTSTTTNPPVTSTTTPVPIVNTTTEVISDLSLQDAKDGLEFFKIYNDFMLAKLASRLSQEAHERRMLKSVKNPNENSQQNAPPPVLQNPTQTPPQLSDFSTINENDIKTLRELDLCLKGRKSSTNANGNVPTVMADETVKDATNDNRGIYKVPSDNYKFLLS